MRVTTAASIIFFLTASAGCSDSTDTLPEPESPIVNETVQNQPVMNQSSNPFFTASSLQFQYPPFDRIENQHYLPALEAGMREQIEEVEAIAANPEPATVENTIVARECD